MSMNMPTTDPSTGGQSELHTSADALLQSHGHRYTSARRRIVEVLRKISGPVTIPQLIAHDEQLTQSSTYRNLTILEESGVATRVVTPDDHARFELDEALTRHHHHLICTSCGEVQDFELPEALERSLDQELHRIGRNARFDVHRHSLDLLGHCADCS